MADGKIYLGDRTIDGCEVTVDGSALDQALDVKVICDDGFEWSYDGAGPAQLGLAILADHFGTPEPALRHYEAFTTHVVANFNNEWEMRTVDIERALSNIAATA